MKDVIRYGNKAQATRERIYSAAKQLFQVNPFEEVTIEDIVEKAGVSKGSFYVYFKSKDELIAKLIQDYTQLADGDYSKYLAVIKSDERASVILLKMVEKITEELEQVIGCYLMKTLYRLQLTDDYGATDVVDYNRELYSILASIIELGISRGEFKPDVSTSFFAKSFVAMFRGLTYEWCVRYPDYHYKDESVKALGLLIESIKT